MTTLTIERGGHLIADDYNFAAGNYGNPAPDETVGEQRRRIRSTLFVPNPLPELKTENYGQFEPVPGVVAERVSYETAYGLRVPAIVYRPKKIPEQKMPGIIVVNGHGGDKYTWYSSYTGILYARAGAAVVTYDPIREGERNVERKDGTRQHDRKIDPPEMARRMGGLMMTDVMQAVSYLISRPDVGAQHIAAVGYSMGSFVLALTCAVDIRLNSCVLAGGGNLDGPGGYWDSSTKVMCQAIPYRSLNFLGDRGPVIYNLHAERGATLIINGSADDVVSMPQTGAPFFRELRQRTIALHGSDHNVFEVIFIAGGGHRPYFVTRPAALWLEKRLHFPYWTTEAIEKMPTTKIGDWAARNGVPIDKLYATDLREYGTEALGTGIPAVPHDELNALPREQWEANKHEYVYETWVENARAAADETVSSQPRQLRTHRALDRELMEEDAMTQFSSQIARTLTTHYPRRAAWLAALAAFLFATTSTALAQNTGQILGTITDSSGAGIAGARITAQGEGTGLTRAVTTTSDGAFTVAALPVGKYTVVVDAASFKKYQNQNVVVDAEHNVRLDVVMEPGTVTEQVSVNEAPPQVDTTSATLGSLIPDDLVRDLPLSGRNVIALTQTLPLVAGINDLCQRSRVGHS